MRSFRRFVWPLGILVVASLAIGRTAQDPAPAHLTEALKLVDVIRPDQTEYRHRPSVMHWPDDAEGAECRTDCSGFVDLLLRHSYPWATRDWLEATMGKKRPLAGDYFDAIQAHKGFRIIRRIGDVQPGDFIVMKYPVDSDNTGHMMLIAERPSEHRASEPLQDRTQQWAVPVIDETSSYHGTKDSRYTGPGEKHGGLGRGTFRVYTESDGTPVGYTWSLSAKGEFYGSDKRPMVIARLDPTGH